MAYTWARAEGSRSTSRILVGSQDRREGAWQDRERKRRFRAESRVSGPMLCPGYLRMSADVSSPPHLGDCALCRGQHVTVVPRRRNPAVNPASPVPTLRGVGGLCPFSASGTPAGCCSWTQHGCGVRRFYSTASPRLPHLEARPSHLALLFSTFKVGTEEPALCRGSPEGSTLAGSSANLALGTTGDSKFSPRVPRL